MHVSYLLSMIQLAVQTECYVCGHFATQHGWMLCMWLLLFSVGVVFLLMTLLH